MGALHDRLPLPAMRHRPASAGVDGRPTVQVRDVQERRERAANCSTDSGPMVGAAGAAGAGRHHNEQCDRQYKALQRLRRQGQQVRSEVPTLRG
jgi:hypothetical protein